MENIRKTKEIVSLVTEHSLDYVAIVVTPWHIDSFLAALEYIETVQKRKLSGVVVILKHPQTGFCFDKNNVFVDSSDSVFIEYYDSDFSKSDKIETLLFMFSLFFRKKRVFEKKDFFVFSPAFPSYCFNKKLINATGRNVVSVITDEGIGSYLTTPHMWATFYATGKGLLFVPVYVTKRLKLALFGKKYENMQEKRNYLINCSLFCLKSRQILLNRTIIPYFLSTLSNHKQKVTSVEKNEKYVLVNTDPLSELLKDPNKDKQLYLKTFESVCGIFHKYGFMVYIKPHPRESGDLYKTIENVAVMSNHNNFSQEEMMANVVNKPAFLVGFDSSTLVTMHVFFDIQSISILPLIKNLVLKDSISHLKGILKLNPKMSLIESTEELEKVISDFQANNI